MHVQRCGLHHECDGKRIQSTLMKNIPVLLDMRWHPPTVAATDRIWFGLWMDPLASDTQQLLNDLRVVALSFGTDRAQFVPHFVFHNGTQSRCVGNVGQEGCFNVCVNNGRYCYPSHKINGVSVMTEIAHRICLWKHTGESSDHNKNNNNNAEQWWNYVTYFDKHCISWDQQQYGTADCVQQAYVYAGLCWYRRRGPNRTRGVHS